MTTPPDFTLLRQAVWDRQPITHDIKQQIELYIRNLPRAHEQSIADDPFLLAAKLGHDEIVKNIIDLGSNNLHLLAEQKDPNGFYAMHLAAANGHKAVVSSMLEKMANLCRKRDRKGWTPLHHAIINSYLEVMITILEKDINSIDDCTHKQETCFHIAVKYKRSKEFKVLLDQVRKYTYKAKLLNNNDEEGNNILHIAVSDKLFLIVECIVPGNCALCNINMENAYGLTALNLCCRGEKDRLIERILIDAGAQKTLSWISLIDPIIHSTIGERQVMLVIPSMAAAGALALLGSPLDTNTSESTEKKDLHIQDVLKHPGSYLSKFLGALSLTFVFILAILVMSLAVWSVQAKLSLLALLLLSLLYYAIALATKMAGFNIICGSLHIPSHCLVWVGVLISYVFVALVITLSMFIGREWKKLKHPFWNLKNKSLSLPLRVKTP